MMLFAVVCLVLSVGSIFLAKGLWKRVLASNIAVSLIVMIIILIGLESQISYYLDIALAFALLSFIGTQFFARFLSEREGDFDD